MATYKVIQDIEAEDKLVGPLTLRQFVYAGITMLCLYLCFIGLTKGIIVIIPLFLPVAFITGFFAFPWGREQPTEIWALAKIRFMIKPRRRIWNQSGVKELVTITAPKKIEHNYTNGLSQNEVKSRLKALADTIDSRGWAIKNVNVNLYAQPLDGGESQQSDRLVGASTLPQDVSAVDIRASDDILDAQNNPVAQQFEAMIEKSAQDHRQQVIQTMNQVQNTGILPSVTPPQALPQPVPAPQSQFNPAISSPVPQPQQSQPQTDNYWFMQQPATSGVATQIVAPGTDENDVPVAQPGEPTADERALAERLREQSSTQQVSYSHLHTIQPMAVQQAAARARVAEAQKEAAAHASAMTAQPDPAIIAFASNNDLNVATIARQANKQQQPDEVIISLH